MKKKTIFNFFLIFVFIFLFIGYTAGQTARGKARLSGEVVDGEGNPIISAKVTIEYIGDDIAKHESTTNNRGAWGFLSLGTGQWKISASAEGYIPASTEVYVRQLEKNPKVTLTLQKLLATDKPLIEDEESFELLDQGNELYDEGKFEEAALIFTEFFEKNPRAYQVRFNIYNCYREMGEYEKAIEQCNIILKEVSTEDDVGKELAAKALAGIGECYLKQQDIENAQNYFKQSVETYPDNELIAYNVGEIFFSNQKLGEAVHYFTLATEIKPDWSDAYYKLGLVYLNNADYENAIKNFEKFLTLETDTERAANVKNILDQLK